MRDLLNKAEHYRKLAVKYHELSKFARPAYLGDFYRQVAVRYVFMAQEVSERAKKDVGLTAERSGSPTVERGGGHARSVAHRTRDFSADGVASTSGCSEHRGYRPPRARDRTQRCGRRR
jgi:hypothetical protein